MSGIPPTHFASMGTHAQTLAKNCPDAKLAMALQCAAVGSMVMMGLLGTVHLIKEINSTWHKEPASHRQRELLDRANDQSRGR